MSRFCPRCGSMLLSDGKCRFCGYTLEKQEVVGSVKKSTPPVKKCPVCFADLDSDGKCRFCGYKHSEKDFDGVDFVDEEEVAAEEYDSYIQDNLFNYIGWELTWKEARDNCSKLGILLTNTVKLNENGYTDLIKEFIAAREKEGIYYYLLDLANHAVTDDEECNSCESVVDLLEKVYDIAIPDYLFLLGDETVVPSILWDNESRDSDKTVRSDLPFITLDCNSPWSGKKYDFNNVTGVGRLPCNQITLEGVKKYIQTLENYKECGDIKALAYSAKEWDLTSRNNFAHLKPAYYLSPAYTINQEYVDTYGLKYFDVKTGEFDFLNFNLHGSDQTNIWYGQSGSAYPEAFDAKGLPQKDGYAILTEACYGAKSKIGKSSQSILVTALFNGCLAFVGSSRIAYGCGNGQMSCADVISYVYTKEVQNGATFGTAFLKALEKMCSSDMDEEDIKTIAEFSLYGDPSAQLHTMTTGKKAFSMVKRSKTVTDEKYSIKLMSCTIGEAGGMSLYGYSAKDASNIMKIVKKLSDTSNTYVASNYATYKNVQPDIYKVVGKSGYRAIYTKDTDSVVKSILKVHLDDNGEIKKTYFSK